MMTKPTTLLAVLSVLAWGCGGSSTETHEAHEVHSEASHGDGDCDCDHCAHGRGHHGGHHGRGHEEHHGAASGPVADFHAVLSPLWHAAPGASRTDGTCAAVEDMRGKAQAIQTGAAPEGADEAAYREAATGLTAAVEALGTACAEAGRPSFDARFASLHDAFHAVAERSGGHREHGEHGHAHEHGHEHGESHE